MASQFDNFNKRISMLKNIRIIIVLFIIFSLFSVFSLSACGQAGAPLDTVEEADEPETAEEEIEEKKERDEITSEELEAAIEALEEQIDYESAEVDAELVGYIPQYLCLNRANIIRIDITNTSDFTWRSSGPDSVRVGYHYYGQDVDYVDYDQTERTLLPEDVEPGETVSIDVTLDSIENEGNYVIQIDLVLEGRFWFSSKGVEMIEGKAYVGICSE